MNLEVPEITEKEICDNVDFIMDALVVRNNMSLKVLTEDGKGVMILPVAQNVKSNNDIMDELQQLQKDFESQVPFLGGALPPTPPF